MAADVDDGGFAWRETGAGDLIVLLHGLGGSRLSWEPQLSGLAGEHRVAAWDMPGYGAAPRLVDGTTFGTLAQAAADWIAVLGHDSAHVVGISMGGMIAQYLAAWHPDRVRSLTLLATSPAFGMDGTSAEQWRAERLAPLDDGLEPADFADHVLRQLAAPTITAELLDGQRKAMERVTSAALRRSIDCLITHDSRALLSTIAAPTLVLVGELDVETPRSYAQHLSDHLPSAWLQVVPAVGHLLNAEAPAAVNEAIIRHIRHVEAR